MIQRDYIFKFAFLLSIIQSAIVVYLSVTGINDGQFYDKLFYYSLVLSLVPIVFAIILFGFSNLPDSYIKQTNVSVNGNIANDNIEKNKGSQVHETSIYLIILGILGISYSVVFKFLSLPYWVIFAIPSFLSILIIRNNQISKLTKT